VEGFAEARAAQEDLRRQRRAELVSLLIRQPAAPSADITATAQSAGWSPPASIAAIACSDEDLDQITGRLPMDALVAVIDGDGCVLFPDPDGPGRREQLQRAVGAATVAVGPTTGPADAAASWQLAKALLLAIRTEAVPGSGVVRAEDHLTGLLLASNPHLTKLLASRCLAPLNNLTPRAQSRMRATARAHVRHHGNAVAMAAELNIHPQTARYRIARLKELFGEDLDDPDSRLELELALRATS
jgi:hypothetical protein